MDEEDDSPEMKQLKVGVAAAASWIGMGLAECFVYICYNISPVIIDVCTYRKLSILINTI